MDRALLEQYGQKMLADIQVELKGRIEAEIMSKLVAPEVRPINTFQLAELWREQMPEIAGLKKPEHTR